MYTGPVNHMWYRILCLRCWVLGKIDDLRGLYDDIVVMIMGIRGC